MNATRKTYPRMSDAEILAKGLDIEEVKAGRKPILSPDEALALATTIAGDNASVAIHHGSHGEVAIRVWGCFKDDAEIVARKIALAIPGEMVSDGGFVAVWF